MSLSNYRISLHHLILLIPELFSLSSISVASIQILFPVFLFLNFFSFLLYQYSISPFFSSSTSPFFFLRFCFSSFNLLHPSGFCFSSFILLRPSIFCFTSIFYFFPFCLIFCALIVRTV
ncbi:hypothetical protein AAZX31_06G186700 [Glycine max]